MQAELFILSVIICKVSSICSPKKLNLINIPEKPKRSKPFTVEVTAIKCPGMNNIFYRWEVDVIAGPNVQSSDGPSLIIDGYKYSSKNIFLKDFNVTVWLSHYEDMSGASSVSKKFQFFAEKLHIEIKGGTEKTHPLMTSLIMDAKSLSRDTSYPPDENAFEGSTIKWFIKPEIPGFTAPDRLLFTVPSSFLSLNQVYAFKVVVERRKISNFMDSEEASQVVTIIDQGSPEINIACQRNCIRPNVKETTVFLVTCSKNCQNINYRWRENPALDPDKKDLGDGHTALVIQPGAFKPNDKITVTVQASSALSTYSLAIMNGITKGTCYVTPTEGISGVTLFNIHCAGFYSANGDLLYVIYQKNTSADWGVILSQSKSSTGNYVYLAEGSPAVMVVKVRDDVYLQEEVELQVQIKPFSSVSISSVTNAITASVFKGRSSSVMSLSVGGFRNKVVQMVSCLLDAIKSSKDMTDSEKKDLHKDMAESFVRLKPNDFDSADQRISILTKLHKFKLSTDTYSSQLIGESVLESVTAVHDMINHDEQSSIPTFIVDEFARNVIALGSDLVKKVAEVETELQQETVVNDYHSYDELLSSKLEKRDDLRELVDAVLISLKIVGSNVIHRNVPNEKAKIFETESMTFATQRMQLMSLLPNHTVAFPNITESKVTMSEDLKWELQGKHNFVDYQFAVFKKNPFWWHHNASRLSTDIVHFGLLHHYRKISSMKNPFYVHLKTKSVPTALLKGTATGNDIMVHRVKVEPGFVLVAAFKASSATYKVTFSDYYCNEKDFAQGIVIWDGANESQRTLHGRPSKGKDVIYICIKTLKAAGPVNYEGSLSVFSCVYWERKTGRWNSEGCKVQGASLQNGSLMVCECRHSSFFAGLVRVPPNEVSINVGLGFQLGVLKTWAMLPVLLVTFLFWSAFLICAYFRDKHIENKNFIHSLDDNVPGDRHRYLMVVFTGVFLDAGTTADVAFQLLGDRAKSRVHLMKCEGVTLLKRNSQDWFIVTAPCCLGKLKKIRLWHNCKGKKPHWYCQMVVVRHLGSGLQYCFVVEKWFSLVWGEGRIYHEINTTDEIDLHSAKAVLSIKDRHIWLSIFSRYSRNNFNSREQVGAAMSAFYLSMLAHAIFYGVHGNMTADSIDPRSSNFIDYNEVVILLESFFVTVPVGILVTLLFRNSKPVRRSLRLNKLKNASKNKLADRESV